MTRGDIIVEQNNKNRDKGTMTRIENELEFSPDELKAPDWLNKDFFGKILKSYEKTENLEVLKLEFAPGGAKNDHYASTMFKVTIDYHSEGETQNKNLLIKMMPEMDGVKKEFLKDSKLFETEISIYTEIIPKFEKILAAAGDNTKFGVP